jgi:tetratricopeptide (TPR) repeat protein
VALTPATRHTLAEKPTTDVAAYEAYLRGLDLELKGASPSVLRRTIPEYLVAVTRDSMFALAWARLGVTEVILYSNAVPSASLADSADKATARALALAPDLPEARIARARYYTFVRHDLEQSKAQIDSGLALSPTSAPLLRSTAANEEQQGRWSEAMTHAQQSVALEPRDLSALTLLCDVAIYSRDTAVATNACGRALSLAPENLLFAEYNAIVALARGDLAGAQRVVHSLPATLDQSAVVAQFAEYLELGWVLDSLQQARLLTLRPDAFDNDRAAWAICRAELYSWRGDSMHTRIYADSALRPYREQLTQNPTDDQRHLFLGLALAYLGQTTDAITEAERGAALLPVSRDAHDGAYDRYLLARVYLTAGKPEKALDVLERVIANPFYVTPAWLRIDPTWTSLHGNPRFERLTAAQ